MHICEWERHKYWETVIKNHLEANLKRGEIAFGRGMVREPWVGFGQGMLNCPGNVSSDEV